MMILGRAHSPEQCLHAAAHIRHVCMVCTHMKSLNRREQTLKVMVVSVSNPRLMGSLSSNRTGFSNRNLTMKTHISPPEQAYDVLSAGTCTEP